MNHNDDIRMTDMADGQTMAAGPGIDLREYARLREELDLVRRELAWVQSRDEAREERLAELTDVERDRDRLAAMLARHLARPAPALQIGGRRGWLIRRLMPDLTPVVDPLVELIEGCGFFDAGWYLRKYPDVAEGGERPAVHYLHHGGREGRWAGPRFDSAFYLARYPDVRDSGINPLVHYLQLGQGEGRITLQPTWQPRAPAPASGP